MKIVIADSMEPEIVEEMRKLGEVAYKPSDLTASLTDADALLVRSATKVTEELLASSPKLRLVGRAGVGLDNVDVSACGKRNIKVVNTPGASANAVAELAIGLMISMLRNVQKAHLQMKNGVWGKSKLVGNEVSGKKLGVVGYGSIGRLVSQKAIALGMTVLAHDPKPSATPGIVFVDLDTLFKESDIITLHTVLVPATRNLVNSASIAKMKQGAFLVNTGRGELVDEDALYEACKSGKLAGAALDVYPQEPYAGKLLELDNVCFTPHLGASTKEAQMRIGTELVEQLKKNLQ